MEEMWQPFFNASRNLEMVLPNPFGIDNIWANQKKVGTLKTRLRILIVQWFLLALIAGCADQDGREPAPYARTQDSGDAKAAVEKLELPPRFQTILKQEMNQLTGGMGALLPYMVQGQNEQAAEVAMNIHASFILKQELSEVELKELVSLLPKEFVQMDRSFHQLAEEISVSLRNKEFGKSGEIYGDMVNACLNCYAQFATESFPGLKPTMK